MIKILILLVLVSLIIKIHFQIYLDKKHNRFQGYKPSTMQPINYFFPYFLNVEIKYKKLKIICNVAYWVMISAIVILLFYSFLTGKKIS